MANAKDDFTEQLCGLLENVTVENDDALKIIGRYDCPEAFHFVDPPYINSDCGHYEEMFGPEDMYALLGLLERIEGKFMLTMFPYGPVEASALRNGWTVHRVERTISAAKDSRRRQEEWMVCNYEPDTDAVQGDLF